MPNQRQKGSTLVNAWVSATLLKSLDKCRGKSPRTQYVIKAITEKMRRDGEEVVDDKVNNPFSSHKNDLTIKSSEHAVEDFLPLIRAVAESGLQSCSGQEFAKLLRLQQEVKYNATPALVKEFVDALRKCH